MLIELGFRRARALRGGIQGWRVAGNPLAPLAQPLPSPVPAAVEAG